MIARPFLAIPHIQFIPADSHFTAKVGYKVGYFIGAILPSVSWRTTADAITLRTDNPTPPMWVVTDGGRARPLAEQISIHTTRVGGDQVLAFAGESAE